MTLQEKQQYLIRFLTMLKGKWSLAEGLLLLVAGGNMSETSLDGMISLLSSTLHEVDDELVHEALLRGQEMLHRIQYDEQIDRERENKLLCELEKNFL